MAMQRLVDIEVDSDFNIHTSYHSDFFLLRTKVLVNGENATIKSVKEDSFEEPVMSFCHNGSTISTKLWSIENTISPILHKCGVYHVDTFYYEQSPLFHVVFSSESCLRKFLLEVEMVKYAMQLDLLSLLLKSMGTKSSQDWLIVVEPELFLVSPNWQNTKGADLHLVTAENCSTFISRWKDSKLFDFDSLYGEKDEPPIITVHPQDLKNIVPSKPLTFTVQATGTKPLNYQWERKIGDGSGEWQSCDVESFPAANSSTLTIPSVQKSNEGSYRCTVSNCAGSETSQCATLTVADPPRITTHPCEIKDTVPGNLVAFTIQAIGTEPLNYQWERKIGDGSDVERISGANSSTLTILSVQKSNEGSYCCTVSNCAGSETSECATLTVADPPRIVTHPHGVKNAIPEKPVTFSVQATGTEPLNYQWECKIGDGSGGWQLCDVESFAGANSSTLTIPSVQKSNEGSYRCTISNCAGSETSQCATLIVAERPKITTHPQELKCTIPGRPVSFTVQATGTEPLSYQWQWKPVVEGVISEEWQNLSSSGPVQGADTATLMFTSIESCSEGLYRCVVTNVVGEDISEYTDHINGKIRKLRDVLNELSTLNQWYHFGIYLGLHWSTLDAIKKDHAHTEECRTQMLIEWQKRMIPTWSAVVKALVGIGRECLASHLAAKYGVPLPKAVDNKHLEELEIAEIKQKMATGSESTEVHYHRDEFKQLGGRLSEIEQLLKTSRDSQVPLNENVNNLVSELNKLGKEVLKLAQDRENTMLELQRKQHDFQLLSEMKSKDVAHSVEKCQLLQEILTDKKKEIKRLEEELQKKEHQLQSVQQEAQAVKYNLSKLQAELEAKHEEVKTLQKEKEELTRSYITEKEEVKKLVQITLTARDEMEQQLITTKEESEHKTQQIAACKSRISDLSKEVEALSSSLQEKEAAVARLEGKRSSYQKTASTPEQLSDVITLTAEIAELKQKLKEAEVQKQQATLEKDAAVQEMQSKKKVEMQLHRHLDEPPKITDHPKSLKDAVPDKPVTFTIQATGTEPLHYQWQWKLKTGDGNGGWQLCGMERFPGANSSTLTIPTVQKSNEGSYHCTVSNYAGSETSQCATLTVAELPRITTHPKDSTATVPGKTVTFTVQATGTKPLHYLWQWNPAKEGASEEWQPCSGAEGYDTATLTIPSVQKSNRGNYRCVISNCAGSQTSKPAKLERHPLSELTWRRLPDMPRVMRRPQSVTVDTVVYIAVRYSVSGVILRYDLHSQQWMEPLQYQYCDCGMTTVSSQLVMVGGCDVSTGKTTNRVAVYSPSQRRWSQPYPPLMTPRWWPAVSTYHQRLVVAGGRDDSNTDLATVEILNTSVSHCQWLSATGLTVSCHLMSAAITHSTLYLLGGSLDKKVLSVSLSALDKPPAQWRTLPDAPLGYSTAIAVHGSLLAVGGSHGRQRSSAIHVYDQEKNKWNKVGDLPTERQDCACCLLPSGEILVAGEDRNGNWTSRMDVAAVIV